MDFTRQRVSRIEQSESGRDRSCAGCGAAESSEHCPSCGWPVRIGSFRVAGRLGSRTWSAKDAGGVTHALARFETPDPDSLARARSLAASLAQVTHSLLPKVRPHQESTAPACIYVPQLFAEGELLSHVARRHTEREAVEVARALLDACCALHGVSPRLAHGSITARNVIMGEAGVSLVGVASASPGDGTALSQDLEGVGQLLAVLLTPEVAQEADLARAFLQRAGDEGVSAPTRQLVGKLLSREAVSRFRDAAAALEALEHAYRARPKASKPRTGTSVPVIEVPPEPISVSRPGELLRSVPRWVWGVTGAAATMVLTVWGAGRIIDAATRERPPPAPVAKAAPPPGASPPAAPRKAPDRAEELERAEGAFRRGELEEAARDAGAIAKGPRTAQSDHAGFIEARSLHLLGRPEALEATSRYLRANPSGASRAEMLRQRGEILLASNQGQKAFADFDAWLTENPEGAEVATILVFRARTRLAIRDSDGARLDLTLALTKVAAGSPEAYVARRLLDELEKK